jgi:LuxR family maltose regulon positive regulatory protein
MSMTLLVTKLNIPPPRPNLIPRQRLIERLDAGLFSKLTLVSARAGSGKTTLVSNWIHGSKLPTAWVNLSKKIISTALSAFGYPRLRRVEIELPDMVD